MSALIPIATSDFYKLCLRVCAQARLPLHRYYRSKKMYNNFVHVFLLVLKQRLGVSYRRLEHLATEFNLARMLCIKRIPHFTTIQKALQRLSKSLLERMVKACHSLLGLKGMLSAVDGTGFSNTNPSHYYIKRIEGTSVKNFTKTVLLADLDSKLVLNVKSTSDYRNETLFFIPVVSELKHALKCVLADKGYDAASNRLYCDSINVEHIIPVREWRQGRLGYGHKQSIHGKARRRAARLFDAQAYKRRALVESVISAVKRPFGAWVSSRKPLNQQKEVTIKMLAYNLEVMGRRIKVWLFIFANTFLHRRHNLYCN